MADFVKNIDQLIDSTLEFNSKPEYWKAVLSSSPKYFTHININGENKFGLSKFCAFKDITVESYIKSHRYSTDGGTTQKHISKVTNINWVNRVNVNTKVGRDFDNWIKEFSPVYNVNNANFISLKLSGIRKLPKNISPETLLNKLKKQEEIGAIGEEIALKFEINRLKELGIKNPEKNVDHVSKKNVAAGYDIYSVTKNETRFIEVKSTVSEGSDFYISKNEIETLKEFENEAFLYLVKVTNIAERKGSLVKQIKNPIKSIKLEPILFKAKL